jgi:hypothetical protein
VIERSAPDPRHDAHRCAALVRDQASCRADRGAEALVNANPRLEEEGHHDGD